MNAIIKVLIERDGLSKKEAIIEFFRMREEVFLGADPEEVLFEEGFEPDYVFDLI